MSRYRQTMSEALKQVRGIKEQDDKDHEISMARGELQAIADKAIQLSSALQGKSDEGNPLEAWVQSKITKAKDYINSVSDYLMYNPEQSNEEKECHPGMYYCKMSKTCKPLSMKKEELNKDDEKAVKKVKDMLKGASAKHDSQAKMLDKALKSEEAKYPHKMYSKDGKEVEAKTPADHEKYAKMGYTHQKETHSFMTKDMNKSKKDAKGEKEIVDPAPKMKFKEAYKKVKKEAMNTVGDATADQANQRVGEGPKENDPDIKKPKAKADTGSKATPVDTSPEVEYKN